MQADDLINIVAQAANIVEKLERKAEQNIEFSEQAVNKLTQSSKSIPNIIQQTLSNHINETSGEIVRQFKNSIQPTINSFSKEMQETKSALRLALQEIKSEREKMFRFNRIVWFGGLTSLCIAAVILIISCIWTENNYQNFITQNQPEANFVKALKSSSLIRCADNNLCVKVDKNNKKAQVPDGYVLVAPSKAL